MTSKKSNLVADRYASSLLDIAVDKKKVEKVEKDMLDLYAMIEASADFRKLLGNPLISKAQKLTAIEAISKSAKFEKITADFLLVLVQNGRLNGLSDVIIAFNRVLTKRRGEIAATVQTASALTAAQTKKLQDQLSKTLGSNVTMNVSVDKDLLGGMIVTVGSVMVDDSVRGKIQRLGRAMSAKDVQAA